MTSNRNRARVLALLLLSLAACDVGARSDGAAGRASALDGEWAVAFTLESSLRHPNAAPPRVLGEMSLLTNEDISRPPALGGPPTHSGSYRARFAPLGFELRGRPVTPALLARITASDSVEIALQPDQGGPMRLRGVLAGDSIVGRWSYSQHRGTAASGSFRMDRLPAPPR